MSLLELSGRMAETAALLREYADRLDDARFIIEAERFTKALGKFHQVLTGYKDGLTPQANELRALLQNAFPQDRGAEAELAKFSKKALGKRTSKSKNDTYASYLEKFFKSVVGAGKVDYALLLLKRPPAQSVLDFTQEDELSLLEQIRTLGALKEDQLEVEVARLVKDKKMMSKLAEAARIKYKPTTKPETVVKKLVEIGRRYYENTGGLFP